MKRKQIIIILCVALAVCVSVGATQAFSAKKAQSIQENSISQSSFETADYETSAQEAQSESPSVEFENASTDETSAQAEQGSESTAGSSPEGTAAAEKTTAKPADKPTEKKTLPPEKTEVTISITCKNAVNYGSDKAPQSGYILQPTVYSAADGDTAFDVLEAVCKANSISLNYEHIWYVQGIGGLWEKDCGAGSGWMYRVNGTAPNVAACKYTLQDGDVVEWYYVTSSTDN